MSQKVRVDTKLHFAELGDSSHRHKSARSWLALLVAPTAANERKNRVRTNKKLKKPTKNKNLDTHYGVNNMAKAYVMRTYKFFAAFSGWRVRD